MQADRSVLFNLSAATIAEAGTKAAQFAAVAVIARALGPGDFGIVGAAWALFQLALPVVQGAPELLGIRNLSANRSGGLLWVPAITAMKLVLGLAAVAALSAYAALIYGVPSGFMAQIVMQALVLLAVAASPAWAARSFQRTDLYVVPRLLQGLLFAALAGGALALWPVPIVVPIAEAIAWTVATTHAFRILERVLPALTPRRALAGLTDFRLARAAVAGSGRDTFHFAAAGIASAAIWWAPVLMAGTWFGASAGGHVAAAVRLVLVALVAMQLGLQVFLPVLAKYHGTNRDKFRSLVAALAFYSTLAHVAVAAAIVVFAAPLTRLVFGAGFEATVPLVAIAAAALVPIGTGSAYGYALIAGNRSGTFFVLSVAGGVTILAGQFVGIVLTGSPKGIVLGLPCLMLSAAAFAVCAHRGGLVRSGIFSLRRLAPHNIMQFLLER